MWACERGHFLEKRVHWAWAGHHIWYAHSPLVSFKKKSVQARRDELLVYDGWHSDAKNVFKFMLFRCLLL
jgi:hypothetical protein